MSFKSEFIGKLRGFTDVTWTVGKSVFFGLCPQDVNLSTYCLCHFLFSAATHHTRGASGIVNEGWQIDIWSDVNLEADDNAEVLRNRLDGFTGTMGSVGINSLFLVDAGSDVFRNPDGGPVPLYRSRSDFRVWYFRSVPTL